MRRIDLRRGTFSFSALAILFISSFLASPANAHAQEDELKPPPAWKVRLDRPDRGSVEDIWYVDMPPGWHVTTGPAAILWDPARTAEGTYRIESEIFLFDPEGRREGFGIFFGGSDLEGEGQAYGYFLLREGGEFLVKTRLGDDTRTVVDWTAHPAISSWAGRDEDAQTAKNVLAMEIGTETVVFHVNGQEVASVATEDLPVEGKVGLRVNHSVNIHVTTLDVIQRVP
jgi:hypothetical protein